MDEQKLKETGEKLQKVGCALTVFITIPVLLIMVLFVC